MQLIEKLYIIKYDKIQIYKIQLFKQGIHFKWKNLYIDASHPEELELFSSLTLLLKNTNLKIKIS